MTDSPAGPGPTPGTAAATPQRSFGERLVAALKLDASVYEEVEHDPSALPQAAAVVALAAVASGLAAIGAVGFVGVIAGVLGSFIAWGLWTVLVWFVGVKILNHTSDFGELLRTLGFVTAPQILHVIGVIPVAILQALVGIVVLVMTVVAFVRAVRQALDVDTGRAALVSLAAVALYVLVFAGLRALVA